MGTGWACVLEAQHPFASSHRDSNFKHTHRFLISFYLWGTMALKVALGSNQHNLTLAYSGRFQWEHSPIPVDESTPVLHQPKLPASAMAHASLSPHWKSRGLSWPSQNPELMPESKPEPGTRKVCWGLEQNLNLKHPSHGCQIALCNNKINRKTEERMWRIHLVTGYKELK